MCFIKLNFLFEFWGIVSYYLICIIKYVLLCMCKGYRNVDLVNVKGNDVVLNYGYDNLV